MLLLVGMLPALAVTTPGFGQANLLETVCPACGKPLPNMATNHVCIPNPSGDCAEAAAFLKQTPGSGFSPDFIDSLVRSGACGLVIQMAEELRDAAAERERQRHAEEIQRQQDAVDARNRKLVEKEKRRREVEARERSTERQKRQIARNTESSIERERNGWRRFVDILEDVVSDPSALYGGVEPLEVAKDNFNDIYTDEVRKALAKPIEYADNGIQDVFAKGFASIKQSDDLRIGGGYPSRMTGRDEISPSQFPRISPSELFPERMGFEGPVPNFPPNEDADGTDEDGTVEDGTVEDETVEDETVEDELRDNQPDKVGSGAVRPAASTTRNGPPERNGTQKAPATTKPATKPSSSVDRLRERLRAIPTRP
jgi:hypothetical protein